MDQSKVYIEIGGARFVTVRSTLLAIRNTRLSEMVLSAAKSSDSIYLYFDRNSFLFEYILDFYRSGDLHLPQHKCGKAIKAELEFWGLSEADVSSCCWKVFTESTNSVSTQLRISKEFLVLSQKQDADLRANTFKEKLWAFLTYPEWSIGTTVYTWISGGLVLLSLFMLLQSTLRSLRYEMNPPAGNQTETETEVTEAIKNRPVFRMMATTTPHPSLMYADLTTTILFVFELAARFFSCPDKVAFMKSFHTFSDLAYVLPVLTVHIIESVDTDLWLSLGSSHVVVLVEFLFVFRVLRLHRVACCLRGYKILLLSLKASSRELLLLVGLTLLTSVVFAVMIFCAEMPYQDSFKNAFVGMWWAIITMTSAGYGDVVPISTVGYVVGVVCAFVGIIVLSLPVPMIASNFNIYYAYKEEPCAAAAKGRWRGDKQHPREQEETSNGVDSVVNKPK